MKTAQAQVVIENPKRLSTLESFGKLIKGLRLARTSSISSVSEKSGIDVKTWHELESGKIPHREVWRLLPEIANGLGVEAFTLFESLIALRDLRP